MIRKLIIGLVVVGAAVLGTARANNVRIEGEVKVLNTDVDVNTNIASVKVRLSWDNSWRDAFNYDAVYLFMKYKVDGLDEVWHHAYLQAEGHEVPRGYTYLMSNSQKGVSGKEDHCEGIFIYRDEKGTGNVQDLDLVLKWYIKSNPDKPLNRDMFSAGNVFLSAMGIEMVYIPRGAFRAGDTYSENTFANKDVVFPAKDDLLTEANIFSVSSESQSRTNPPSMAVNKMNDIQPDESNAWVGRTTTSEGVDFIDYWQVQFKESVALHSLAIESVAGHVPTKWALQMQLTSGQWRNIYPKYGENDNWADGSEWAVGSRQTYPCTRTLQINNVDDERSSVYRVVIMETTAVPWIKNISLSERDIIAEDDNSVVVYDSISKMSDRYGLYANDEDTWAGVTDPNYPNGYKAFFAMKYELSQEQYVSFLNKLTAEQQRARTIGTALGALKEGMYVFGGVGTRAVGRNGIKLASIGLNDAPYVFANDLDPRNDYAQDGDGQTVACNFLNAGDMMAYADWCGLRPMSEMEFEKMARRPFPEEAIRGEYAWNTAGDFTVAQAYDGATEGTSRETVGEGKNVNALNYMHGPVRCGAFAARAGSSQVLAGASFWGVMELSGNLSEIYYSVNSNGRVFRGLLDSQHGSGEIGADGKSDATGSFWPENNTAFTLRGGNFRDTQDKLRISDRSRITTGVYGSVTEVNTLKDSTTTFRLGRTAPVHHRKLEVMKEDGTTSATATPVLVCSGEDYTISGDVPRDVEGAYRVAWFMSSDQGENWDLLVGEEAPSLKLTNLKNINAKEDVFKEYWYKRYVYSNKADYVQTYPVKLKVINQTLILSSHRDTVDVYDRSKGIRIESPQAASFKWTWVRDNVTTSIDAEYTLKDKKVQKHFFEYDDFFSGSQYMGDQKIMLEVTVLEKCKLLDSIFVYVDSMPKIVNGYIMEGTVGKPNPAFQCGDILKDNEEDVGQVKGFQYKTVEIGGRCWFAENLKRPHKKGNSLCYNGVDANCERYGRLYNWKAATGDDASEGTQGLCPMGWHIPSDAEWKTLLTAVGTGVNTVNNGKELKSPLNDWAYPGLEAKIGANGSGFDALPGGGYFYACSENSHTYATDANGNMIPARNGYKDVNVRSWWWTSTSISRHWTTHGNGNQNHVLVPYYVRMDYENNELYTHVVTGWGNYGGYMNSIFCSNTCAALTNSCGRDDWALPRLRENFYFSVRCIQDE